MSVRGNEGGYMRAHGTENPKDAVEVDMRGYTRGERREETVCYNASPLNGGRYCHTLRPVWGPA